MQDRVSSFVTLFLVLAGTQMARAQSATEAEILALKSGGELLPSAALVNEIEADLQLIRDDFPVLRQVSARAPWVPGELLMGLTPQAYASFRAGEHAQLNALNDRYGPLEISWRDALEACRLIFSAPYHPELLSVEYGAIEGVDYAEPNHIAGDGPDIIRHEAHLYTFRYAWGDCPAGCLSEHIWQISVDCGFCRLRFEQGDDLPSWVPAEQGGFGGLKASFRAND